MQSETIIQECIKLREKVVQPLSDKYNGPLNAAAVRSTKLPMVLLLGNHSSGKSSFINHLLKRTIQASGVAPTDDCFTIIAPGDEDADRAGPALVGDPDLGFSGLNEFGAILVHKTQLKIRNLAPRTQENPRTCHEFYLVDTPGMIDSPIKANASHQERVMDRGYDFEGVCKWYAERADIILLLFDPEKPGTTGETMHCLVNSLAGLDHKLHIVLNKADQFHRIDDFARAYGSLCWNLSKVIPRKDMPQIHTMCLPGDALRRRSSAGSTSDVAGDATGSVTDDHDNDDTESRMFAQGLKSLDHARKVVEDEVFLAPRRRVDNEISRLAESVHLMLMHTGIVGDAVDKYQNDRWRARMATLLCTVGAAALTALVGFSVYVYSLRVETKLIDQDTALATQQAIASRKGLQPSNEAIAQKFDKVRASSILAASSASLWTAGKSVLLLGSLSGGVVGIMHYFQKRALEAKAATLNKINSFAEIFQTTYARQIAAGDQFTFHLWSVIRRRLLGDADMVYDPDESDTLLLRPSAITSKQNMNPVTCKNVNVLSMQRISQQDISTLLKIVNDDIPALRRRASPPSLSSDQGLPVAELIVTDTNINSNRPVSAQRLRAGSVSTSAIQISDVHSPEL